MTTALLDHWNTLAVEADRPVIAPDLIPLLRVRCQQQDTCEHRNEVAN